MRTKELFSIIALSIAALISATPADAALKKDEKKEKEKTEEVDKSVKLSEYEKIFKDKRVETAKSFMKIHLLDKKTYIAELPKDVLGRDMLITSSVDQTSNGADAGVGFKSLKSIHVAFEKTDSLMLLKEVDSYKWSSSGNTSYDALKKSHIGAVIATFPIKTMSPDSTAYVFDMTKFLASYDKRLAPTDPFGAASFGGLLSANLTHKPQLSMPYGLEAYPENISILSWETFSQIRSLGSLMANSGDGELLSVAFRKNILLLPEKPAQMRYADPRIGVKPVVRVRYSDKDGSEDKWYAERWNLEDGKKIVFYVDTLFTQPFSDAITKGILKWNDAFEAMGKGQVLEARPYPSDDPDFSPNDLRYSCVRHEVVSSEKIRSNSWTDPRSGEIICASITVPFDVLLGIHANMLVSIGGADPELKTVKHTAPVLFEGLQAIITREIGKCLGLDINFAASGAVPADSLRSPSFTGRYGLSASIMDDLPYNYFAKPGDKEKGVVLVHTNVGEYDKYAVNWLYCDVPGAKTAEDEKAYLDSLIIASRDNNMCRYIRRPSPYDVRRMWEPRCLADDLGDDPFRSVDERLNNLKENMSTLDSWIDKEDYDYTFRPYLNGEVFFSAAYPVLDLLTYVGGIYVNEKLEGDSAPTYEVVDKATQQKALKHCVDIISNLSWLDDCQAWRDIFFVRSFADYTHSILVGELPVIFHRLALSEQKANDTYTVIDAYEDIMDSVLEDVKKGNISARDNLLFQYLIVGQVMEKSNINPRVGQRAAVQAIDDIRSNAYMQNPSLWDKRGFAPMPAFDFAYLSANDFRIYNKLKEIREVYSKAIKKVKDESLKNQYEYFLMAIDRALKLD